MCSTPSIVVWFWQRIISPHIARLASALSRQGFQVTYVTERGMSQERAKMGWIQPKLDGVQLEYADSLSKIHSLVLSAPPLSIHICQGIRGNGIVRLAQKELAKHNHKQWVVMEMVDDSGLFGILKRFAYYCLFKKWGNSIQGVLAIGQNTPNWIVKRGFPQSKIFPFAYFLSEGPLLNSSSFETYEEFRFIFVGQFIQRKQLELLITCLGNLDSDSIKLTVIGSGPLEHQLQALAEKKLPGKVKWIGKLPMTEVAQQMAKADCLVLPSRYDGWGAVISEALMLGVPVVCSGACGAAGVVRRSGHGGVFPTGDADSLIIELRKIVSKGRLSQLERKGLIDWAKCLGAKTGAQYLKSVVNYDDSSISRPSPPWDVR